MPPYVPQQSSIIQRDDIIITEQLRAAERLVGIELLDHISAGDDGQYVSLRER